MIERWGSFVARRALAVLLAGLAVAVAAGGVRLRRLRLAVPGRLRRHGLRVGRASWPLEQDTFGNQGIDVVAIYSSEDLTASDPEFQAEVQRVVEGYAPGTTSRVVPYYAAPDAAGDGQRGRPRRPGADLAGRHQPGRLPHQLRRARADARVRRRTPASRPTSPARSRSSTTSTRSPARTSPAPRRSRCRSCSSSPC